jgi:hypothetical protein
MPKWKDDSIVPQNGSVVQANGKPVEQAPPRNNAARARRGVEQSGIPDELRKLPRWTCWQETENGSKPPIQATAEQLERARETGRHVYAKPNDPSTWTDFESALRYGLELLEGKGPAWGLSFALNGDGIVGIDLDHCRDAETQKIAPWAEAIMQRFRGYWEISPSGEGLRSFLRGKLPPGGRKQDNIETYDDGKVLSVTGWHLTSRGSYDSSVDHTPELAKLHAEVFGAGAPSTPSTSTPSTEKENTGSGGQLVINNPSHVDAEQLLRLVKAKPQVRALFEGTHGKNQSSAEQSLANYAINAGWTEQETCDLLVGARLLKEEPPKHLGYYEATIDKAVTARQERQLRRQSNGQVNGHANGQAKGHLVIKNQPAVNSKKLEELFDANGDAQDIFYGGGSADRSEAYLVLASCAMSARWSDQEVGDLLVVAHQNANEPVKDLEYLAGIIEKAREKLPKVSTPPVENAGLATDPSPTQESPAQQNRNLEEGGIPPTPVISIEEARAIYGKYLYLPDPNLVDVTLAVPAGNRLFATDPLWLMLKGPPGSGKTEVLNPLYGLSQWALFVSKLNTQALISGFSDPKSEKDHSLLPQLNGKCLVIKDFTTILAMNDKQRDEIFGILRDVYDGHASKHFGTGRKEYQSRFNLLAGVTSAIERAWHLSALGERFLCWSMDTDHKKQTEWAMKNANCEPVIRAELAKAAAGVLAGIGDAIPEIPQTLQQKTQTLAYLLARLRTYVARDRNDVVHQAPEVEVPTRIVKQLLRLGQSVALVRRKEVVTHSEFALMQKVALDSMPSARRAVFRCLLEHKGGLIEDVAKSCRISFSPAKRHLDDLVLLGLAEESAQDRKAFYRLTSEVRQEWLVIGRP